MKKNMINTVFPNANKNNGIVFRIFQNYFHKVNGQ